jgi:hypothetical protein
MSIQARRHRQMLLVVLWVAISSLVLVAGGATKDEAVAMVQKAVAATKTEGVEKSMPRSATRKARSFTGWTGSCSPMVPTRRASASIGHATKMSTNS